MSSPVMLRAAARVTFLALMLGLGVHAADLQLWNNTQFTAVEDKGAKVDVFGGLRARDHVTDVYDRRIGTRMELPLGSRFGVNAGYMCLWVDSRSTGLHREDRLFAGPNIRLAQRPVRVDASIWYERHMTIEGQPDFNRYQSRVDVERLRKKVSPFFREQVTVLKGTFVRSRSAVGLRWRFEAGGEIDVGYQFESLNTGHAWIPRHTILTGLRLGSLFRKHGS